MGRLKILQNVHVEDANALACANLKLYKRRVNLVRETKDNVAHSCSASSWAVETTIWPPVKFHKQRMII